MFENAFILPLHLIDSLAGYRITDRKYFPLSILKEVQYCVLVYIISVKKPNGTFIIGPVRVVCFSSMRV